jgi:hypothetical protein
MVMQVIRKIALLAFLAIPALAQPPARPRLIVVHGPTIVAFFPPTTQAEADSGEDDAEALSDFNFYAHEVGPRLKQAGVRFVLINGRSFRVRIGGRLSTA